MTATSSLEDLSHLDAAGRAAHRRKIESWINEVLIRSFYRTRSAAIAPKLTTEDSRTVIGRASQAHINVVTAATARMPGGRRVTTSG